MKITEPMQILDKTTRIPPPGLRAVCPGASGADSGPGLDPYLGPGTDCHCRRIKNQPLLQVGLFRLGPGPAGAADPDGAPAGTAAEPIIGAAKLHYQHRKSEMP